MGVVAQDACPVLLFGKIYDRGIKMKYLQNVFQGRSFLDCKDYNPTEINYLIDFALHLKELKKEHIPHEYLKGKNIALLFEKSSTRTRSAFVVGLQ